MKKEKPRTKFVIKGVRVIDIVVRAKMVKTPGNWQWSSFLVKIRKQVGFEGLTTDAVLLQFCNQRSQAIKRFQAFISQGIGQDIWHDLKHQIYLGDDNFVEKHMKHLTNYEGKLSEVPQKQRRKPAKKSKRVSKNKSQQKQCYRCRLPIRCLYYG